MREPDCSACSRLPVLFLLAGGAASSRPRAACQREAKFWLEPRVELAADYGLGSTHINAVRKIIEEHVNDLRAAWAKHFGG
jgi:hypothetical protein